MSMPALARLYRKNLSLYAISLPISLALVMIGRRATFPFGLIRLKGLVPHLRMVYHFLP